jgi:hypothetical protein
MFFPPGYRFLGKQFAKILDPGSKSGDCWAWCNPHGGHKKKKKNKKKRVTWGAVGPPLLGWSEVLEVAGPGPKNSIPV